MFVGAKYAQPSPTEPPTKRRNTSQRKAKKCSVVITRSATIDPARACVRRQNGGRLVLARRALGQTSLADGQGRTNLPFRCEDCLGLRLLSPTGMLFARNDCELMCATLAARP